MKLTKFFEICHSCHTSVFVLYQASLKILNHCWHLQTF